ncbi:MAG: fused MFS/spermidine synthase [Anaerolineae bacterium]|nr:fused MFS/spermidine synthase [Anaerolineae bacterium]
MDGPATHTARHRTATGAWTVFAAVAVAGAGGMALEMTASRMLLPYYGDSYLVWANLIGLVLAALSLGYYVGGAVADRWPSSRLLGLALLGAGTWTAGIPALGSVWLPYLDRVMPVSQTGCVVGSFLAVTILLAAPVLLLGLVPPLAIRLLLEGVAVAGNLTGRVYAVSTVGSMVGTFAPVLWLMPAFGVRATFAVAAAVLGLTGLLGLAASVRRGRAGSFGPARDAW